MSRYNAAMTTTTTPAPFVATDAHGRTFMIRTRTETACVQDHRMASGRREVPVLHSLATIDGCDVVRPGKGVYEVVTPGGLLRVTSDDANAV
jgi:hypothetical protein